MDRDVKAYFENYSPEIQIILHQVKDAIESEIPDGVLCISYGIPTVKLKKSIIHFSANKKHIGLYPGPSAIKQFSKELENFKTAKGSIQFPFDSIPYALIQEITRFRMAEEREKST